MFYDSRSSKRGSDTSCETISMFYQLFFMVVSPYFAQFSSFAHFSMLVYDDRQLGRVPVAQCMYQPPLCLFQSSNGSSFRHSDFPPTSHSAKCHNKFTPSSSMQLRTTQQWSYFGEYPKRPSFPCFPGQTDFAVVLENYLAVVLANNAKWLLIRTLVWIDSRIHSVGRLSEKDYLKDIFQ